MSQSLTIRSLGIVLFLILVIGGGTRYYALDRLSLWADEARTVSIASKSIKSILKFSATEDVHPPLYYLILHGFLSGSDSSTIAARLPSAICGTLSILFMFLLGRLIAGTNTGLVAAALLALSVFHIHYSQEVRAYALLVFLSLASSYFYLRWLQRKSPQSGIIEDALWVVSTAGSLLVHNLAFLGLFVQYLHICLVWWKNEAQISGRLSRWILMQGGVLAIYSLWLVRGITQADKVSGGFGMDWVPLPTVRSIFLCLLEFAGATTDCCAGVRFDGRDNSAALLLLLLFCFLIYKSALSDPHGCSPAQNISCSPPCGLEYLFLWFIVPLSVAFPFSHIFSPVFVTRTLIAASLPFYILAAVGLQAIEQPRTRMALIIVAIVLSLACCDQYFSTESKCQWNKATPWLEQVANKNDLIFFDTAQSKGGFDYYSSRNDLHAQSFPFRGGALVKSSIPGLLKEVNRASRVWLVRSHSLDFNHIAPQLLHKMAPFRLQKSFFGVKILLFSRENATRKLLDQASSILPEWD